MKHVGIIKRVLVAAGIGLLLAAAVCLTGCREGSGEDPRGTDFAETLRDAAQTAADKISEGASKVKENASEDISAAGEKISEGVSRANEALEEGVTRVSEAVSDLTNVPESTTDGNAD